MLPIVLTATEGMTQLTTQMTSAIGELDFTPLYSGMINVLPTVMGVGIAIAGLKKTVSFVFGTLFSF